MSLPAVPVERPALRLSPTTAALLAVGALAWAGAVALALDKGNGPGTMGMAFLTFVGMWALMMTAMMLPAVAPVASLYARTIRTDRAARLVLFVSGYLLAWAVAGLPAYALLRVVDRVVGSSDTAMRTTAAAVLLVAGAYQLTPLKTRCLRHCRSPLAQLLHYGNVRGPFRELKVALHHAGYCLGCCWALMALFVAFGVMNVWAMIGLAAVVIAEKVGPRGEAISQLVAVACIGLAVLVVTSPHAAHWILPGVGHTGMSHMATM